MYPWNAKLRSSGVANWPTSCLVSTNESSSHRRKKSLAIWDSRDFLASLTCRPATTAAAMAPRRPRAPTAVAMAVTCSAQLGSGVCIDLRYRRCRSGSDFGISRVRRQGHADQPRILPSKGDRDLRLEHLGFISEVRAHVTDIRRTAVWPRSQHDRTDRYKRRNVPPERAPAFLVLGLG